MYQYADKGKSQSEKSKANTSIMNKISAQAETKMPVQTKSLFSPHFNATNDSEKLTSNDISSLAQLTPITHSPLQKQLMPEQEQRERQSLPMVRSAEQERLTPSLKKANNTGIPAQMKESFESLSGFSFDDVRVHYNSNKPAQLHALAYTQGNQVYVGSGQEKHLRHELGHVVQQKQGIVRPNKYINSQAINDDPEIEKAADNISARVPLKLARNITPIIQAWIGWVDRNPAISERCQTWLTANAGDVTYKNYKIGQEITVFLKHTNLLSGIKEIIPASRHEETWIELHGHTRDYLIDYMHIKLTWRGYVHYVARSNAVPQAVNQGFINALYPRLNMTKSKFNALAARRRAAGFACPDRP